MSQCVLLVAIKQWLSDYEVMLTSLFSTYWAMWPCPTVWSLASPTRDQNRFPPGCEQTVSQTTLQSIKMPQISPQKLENPRNKGAQKTRNDIWLTIPIRKSCHVEFKAVLTSKGQGCLFVPLQFLAWPLRRETESQKKEKKWPGGIFQNKLLLLFYFCKI